MLPNNSKLLLVLVLAMTMIVIVIVIPGMIPMNSLSLPLMISSTVSSTRLISKRSGTDRLDDNNDPI